MYFTQKLLFVCVLSLGLYFAISYIFTLLGFPIEEGVVANILFICLTILSGWLVFGPLSSLQGPALRGNPLGDAAEDVRYAYETNRPGLVWIKLAFVALIALIGLAL